MKQDYSQDKLANDLDHYSFRDLIEPLGTNKKIVLLNI
jgi:hypothetical protein